VLLLARVDSSVEESLEALGKSLFPEKLFALVLAKELSSGYLNVTEVMGEHLHSSKELELIFDLNQVVTTVGVQTGHLDSK